MYRIVKNIYNYTLSNYIFYNLVSFNNINFYVNYKITNPMIYLLELLSDLYWKFYKIFVFQRYIIFYKNIIFVEYFNCFRREL